MKVLHTISGMNRGSGGPTTCTYNLVRGLRGIGVDTKILTLAPANNGEQYICDEDFIVAVKNDAANPFVYSRNFRDYLRTDTGYDIYHANGLWTYPSHITAKPSSEELSSPGTSFPHPIYIAFCSAPPELSRISGIKPMLFSINLQSSSAANLRGGAAPEASIILKLSIFDICRSVRYTVFKSQIISPSAAFGVTGKPDFVGKIGKLFDRIVNQRTVGIITVYIIDYHE